MRPLVALLVVLAIGSAGCLGGVFDGGEGGVDDPRVDDGADDADPQDDGVNDGAPAPGDLASEVEARFHVDGEPLSPLTLEVVDTREDRARGLMHRESLADDRGMLFVYSGEQKNLSFWMKNTLVPLDIVFLDREMRVVDVEHAAPDPGDVADEDLPRYTSDAPARYVVEVNRGYANETGLSRGDTLEIQS